MGVWAVIVIGAIVVVAVGLGVWLLDAQRNKEVGTDEERLHPDPHDTP